MKRLLLAVAVALILGLALGFGASNHLGPQVAAAATCMSDGAEGCKRNSDCCSNKCDPSNGRWYCFPK